MSDNEMSDQEFREIAARFPVIFSHLDHERIQRHFFLADQNEEQIVQDVLGLLRMDAGNVPAALDKVIEVRLEVRKRVDKQRRLCKAVAPKDREAAMVLRGMRSWEEIQGNSHPRRQITLIEALCGWIPDETKKTEQNKRRLFSMYIGDDTSFEKWKREPVIDVTYEKTGLHFRRWFLSGEWKKRGPKNPAKKGAKHTSAKKSGRRSGSK